MKNIPVLCLIDDDEVYRFTMTRGINKAMLAGKILVFEDGEQAFQFIESHITNTDRLPDIILLDINMPVMDGFQFMEAYNKIKPDIHKKIKIYLVTSSIDPSDIERAGRTDGLSGYLVKPVSIDQLREIVGGSEKYQ